MDKPNVTVLLSNSVEELLLSLKKNLCSSSEDPFSRVQIVVPERHAIKNLQVELGSARPGGVLFGVEITTLSQIAKKASGYTFLDLFIESLLSQKSQDGALQVANERALEMWYGCNRGPEEVVPTFESLPQSIHVFSVLALSPKLNHLFFAMSAHCPVHYYVLSPCMHFWSDIFSEREAKKMERKLKSAERAALRDYQHTRSKLLANNATCGREFSHLLEEAIDNFEERYVVKEWAFKDFAYAPLVRQEAISEIVPGSPTLLDIVQNDLLFLGRGQVSKIDLPQDSSCQIHKAPTLQREIELLYLYIHKMAPSSIVVFAPDIELYRPYIEGIFPELYQIASQRNNEILDLFLKILDIRFDPSGVFELFQSLAFRKKCDIMMEDLQILANCLQKCDSSPQVFAEQIILSWITGHGLEIELSNNDLDALGKCLYTLLNLQKDIETLSSQKTRSALEWVKLMLKILENYIEPSVEQRQCFYKVKRALENIAQNEKLLVVEGIEQETVVALLKVAHDALEEEATPVAFAPIVFASIGQAQAIQKDVVCLLGMQEGSFPRTSGLWNRRLGFMHAAKPPYTLSSIDNNLIIETIFTAKKGLYISYQSYSYAERCPLEPSSIVKDLLGTLDQSCTIEGKLPSTKIVHDHPLESRFEDETVLAPSLERSKELSRICRAPSEYLWMHELSQIAKYPLRAYFQHGLGLYLKEYDAKVRASEFEILDPKSFGAMKRQGLYMSHQEARIFAEKEYRLLSKPLRSAAVSLLEEDISYLHSNARQLGIRIEDRVQIELSPMQKSGIVTLPGKKILPSIAFEIDGQRVELVGTLSHLHPEGILCFERKSPEALFRAWPEILALNVLASQIHVQPNVIFIKDAKVQKVVIDNPLKRLIEYVQYASYCRQNPSCLYPDWISDLQSGRSLSPKVFGMQDPYRELYLSRLSQQELAANWPKWQLFATTLFGGIDEL